MKMSRREPSYTILGKDTKLGNPRRGSCKSTKLGPRDTKDLTQVSPNFVILTSIYVAKRRSKFTALVFNHPIVSRVNRQKGKSDGK